MAGINPRYTDGPLPFPVGATPVVGGQVVVSDGAGNVVPSGALAKNVLGVTLFDGAAAGTDSATDAAARPSTVSVITEAVVPVTYANPSVQGDRLKSAANGEVDVWVDGTDDPAGIIGFTFDASVAGGAVGLAYIDVL